MCCTLRTSGEKSLSLLLFTWYQRDGQQTAVPAAKWPTLVAGHSAGKTPAATHQ